MFELRFNFRLFIIIDRSGINADGYAERRGGQILRSWALLSAFFRFYKISMPVHPRVKDPWGLIQVFTGDGKGKTTSALGTVMRAVGQGKKACVVYFDKGGDHYSERKVLAERFHEIDVVATGCDRMDFKTGRFRFEILPKDIKEAERGWDIAVERIKSGEYDVVVLDEINTTIALGMLRIKPVLRVLQKKPRHVEIICTGRNAPKEIIDCADLVTEMKLVKHYFYEGVPARRGLDY